MNRSICLTLIVLMLVTGPVFVFAQSSEAILARYDRETGIPDEVMLPTFVILIANARFEEEHEGHNHGARLIQRKLAIETYEEADALLDYFVSISDQIISDKAVYFRENICPFDRPRPAGTAVLEELNASDAYHDNLGKKYLAQIRSNLPKQTYDLFLHWMEEQKTGTLIIREDHRHIHRDSDPDMVRQELCGRFDSRFDSAGVRIQVGNER